MIMNNLKLSMLKFSTFFYASDKKKYIIQILIVEVTVYYKIFPKL